MQNIKHNYIQEKEYKVDYVINNPPKYAQKNPVVWEEAFFEYLRRQGIKKPEKLKKVDNVEWNEVIRIYNTMIGKKNRDRKPGFKKQKNKALKVASKAARSEKINITKVNESLEVIAGLLRS